MVDFIQISVQSVFKFNDPGVIFKELATLIRVY